MKNTQRSPLISRFSLLMAAMLVVAFSVSSVARADSTPSKARPAQAAVMGSTQDGVKPAAARAWTTAEMLAAKPFPEPQASAADFAATNQSALARPDGPSGSVPAKEPALSTLDFAVYPPYYRYFPYSTVGKLFFTQYGTNYVCSGAMIKGHAFWTAGHCAHAGNGSSGGWSYNAVFVPQYYYGSAPLGYCYVQNWWTTGDWYYNGNPNGLDHDYAGGNVNCNVAGSTGYLGLAWNQGYGKTWTALGYPQAYPYDGGRMIGCTSSLANYGFGSPTTFGIWCNMTGGSSGGPLYIPGYYVNGNVSYGSSAYPGRLFSPYYDSNVYTLWGYLWS